MRTFNPVTTPAAPRTLKLGRTQQAASAALSTASNGDAGFAWGPLLAAISIDVADVFSVGPVGWVAGLFLGGLLTVMVSLAAGAKLRRALVFGALGGIYCAMPLTGPIPLATMLTLVHAFVQRGKQAELREAAPVPVSGGRVEQLQ